MLETITPLISVITAVHNGADYLPALIESVLAQDYPHYEHIIIDDGSTDDGATVAVLERYPHLRWWSRENKGQYATQNEGIDAALGEILVIIAADDVFVAPDAFRRVVEYWQAHPTCDMVYGKTLRMNEAGEPMPDLEISSSPSRWLIRHFVYVQHCSLFVLRKLIVDNNLRFDPTYSYAGDWDWLIRLFYAAGHIGYLRRPLSIVRMHRNQTSRLSQGESIASEHRRVSQQYGGSYRIHRLFQHFINYRGMALIALHTLSQKGSGGLYQLAKDWYARRFGHE